MGLIFGLKLGMILGALGGGGSVAGGPVGWDGGGRVELASAVEQKMSRAFGGLQKKCKDHSPKRGSEVAVDKGSEALHGKRKKIDQITFRDDKQAFVAEWLRRWT